MSTVISASAARDRIQQIAERARWPLPHLVSCGDAAGSGGDCLGRGPCPLHRMMIGWLLTPLHEGPYRYLGIQSSRSATEEAAQNFCGARAGSYVLWLRQYPGTEMRGQDRELNVALEMARAAEAGRGGILLVDGEPGAGKSRFLRECSDAAARRGLSVACANAVQPFQETPVGAFLPAFTSGGGGPGCSGVLTPPAHEFPGRAPASASGSPTLIAIDDLQFADSVTLWRLRGLAGLPRARAPLWILAKGTRSADRPAERLFGHLERAGASRIELLPLGEQATAEMVADELGAVPGHELLALAAGAEGNPLLLAELLAGLREEGGIQIEGSSARLVSGHLPQRLRCVVSRWVSELGPDMRQLLEVAAVLGRSFLVDHVAGLLGETPAGLLPDVHAALGAGLLVAGQETLAFRRELVWQAVVEGVPTPARQALHRQAGEFLLERGSSPTDAAAHLVSGSQPGDPGALAQLDSHVRALMVTSPETAAELALKVLLLTGHADRQRLPRTVAAVESLAAAMRLADAERLAQSALARPMPAGEATRLRSVLSSVLLYGGRPAAAAAEAESVLAEAGLTRQVRDETQFAWMLGLYISTEDRRATARAEAILSGAECPGDAGHAGALLVKVMMSWRESRLAAALDYAREAVRRTATGPVASRQALPRLLLAIMLILAARLDEAGAVIGALQDDDAEVSPAGLRASTDVLAALLALATGRGADASASAESGLEIAREQGTGLLSVLGIAVLATAALRAGDLRGAGQHLHSFQALLAEDGPGCAQTRCLLLAAQVAEASHDREGAAGLAAEAYSRVARQPSALLTEAAAPAWLVRFALSRQDWANAHAVSAAADGLAAANPGFSGVAAAAAHARGLLDRDSDALRRAAADHSDPWARASAAEDLGVLLLGRHDRKAAGQILERALETFEQTGALRDARRVRRRLRALGIRRRHCTYANRPRSGWASVTDTERAVSELAAQGLTNRKIAEEMFLSTHTVAFHLRQVFRKLDIASRVDLARVLTERNQVGSQTAS